MAIGAAVVGTGFMGRAHVEALRRTAADVVSVLESTAEKSAAAARRWNIPHAAASLDELHRYIETGDFDHPPPFPTFAAGHRQIVLGERILRSAQQQQWIACDDEPAGE